MSEQGNAAPRRGFGLGALVAAAILGLVGGGFATAAVGHGHGEGHGGWGHHGMHGPMSAEDIQKHAAQIVDHVAKEVDATADQKQKLTAIATAMITDLQPAQEKMRAEHKRLADLLRQPKTDRAALESLRLEHVALADEMSKRVTLGLADAADVLTPEQRAKLGDHWKLSIARRPHGGTS